MTRETVLILVVGGAGIVALGAFSAAVWRWLAPAKTTTYRPKHSGEFPIVPVPHKGADDSQATSQWVHAIGSVPSLLDDPYINLRSAREQLRLAELRVREAEEAVTAFEHSGVHATLDEMEQAFRDRLARTGQDLMDTHEWRRGDVDRMVAEARR